MNSISPTPPPETLRNLAAELERIQKLDDSPEAREAFRACREQLRALVRQMDMLNP